MAKKSDKTVAKRASSSAVQDLKGYKELLQDIKKRVKTSQIADTQSDNVALDLKQVLRCNLIEIQEIFLMRLSFRI